MTGSAQTALYRHFDAAGTLLYVGISHSAVQRLQQHMNGSRWARDIASVQIAQYDSREAALAAERLAIINERPLWNVIHNTSKPKAARPVTRRQADDLAVDAGSGITELCRRIERMRSKALSMTVTPDDPCDKSTRWYDFHFQFPLHLCEEEREVEALFDSRFSFNGQLLRLVGAHGDRGDGRFFVNLGSPELFRCRCLEHYGLPLPALIEAELDDYEAVWASLPHQTAVDRQACA